MASKFDAAAAKVVVDKTPTDFIEYYQYRYLDRHSMLLAAGILIIQINLLDLSVGGMAAVTPVHAAIAPIHVTMAAVEAYFAMIIE